MDNLAAFPNKAAIKAEAGTWIARIDRRELSEADVRDLQDWVRRSDFHRDYLLKLAAHWDAMGVLEELAQLFPLPETEPHRQSAPSLMEKLLARLKAGLALPAIKGGLALPMMAAATAASLLLAVFVLTQTTWLEPKARHDYATAIGEQAQYTLEDGTTVTLNTNSQLTVDYADARRAVTLVRGEASFDVAKNPERPFVVYAGGGMVWAVCTAFNVRYLTDGVDVIVTEGKVKVFSEMKADAVWPDVLANEPSVNRPAGEPGRVPGTAGQAGAATGGPGSGSGNSNGSDSSTGSNNISNGVSRNISSNSTGSKEALLTAGQSIRYAQTIQSVQPVAGEELTRKLAWQRGSLIFKGETLEQALTEIARYTDKELVIVDPAIRGLEIGGHYKTDDINQLLAALEQGLNINVEQVSERRIQLSAK